MTVEGLLERFGERSGVTIGGGRRGFGSDALQYNGRIFAMVRDGDLILKLPAARIDALARAGAGVRWDAGKGRPMREWIRLPPGSAVDADALAEEALRFAMA